MEDRNQELPQQDNSEDNNAEESPEDDLARDSTDTGIEGTWRGILGLSMRE